MVTRSAQMKAPSERAPRSKYAGGYLNPSGILWQTHIGDGSDQEIIVAKRIIDLCIEGNVAKLTDSSVTEQHSLVFHYKRKTLCVENNENYMSACK